MKSKIIVFTAIAYAMSWLIWLPNILAKFFDIGSNSNILHVLGGLGPFIAAIITIFIYERGAGLKKFFIEKFLTKPKLKWVGVGFGFPILFFVIATLGIGLFSGHWINLSNLGLSEKLSVSNPLLIWLIWCIFFGIGEETGWRGLLFPEFTKKYKARISTLYVAIIWAFWHTPLFLYDSTYRSMGFGGAMGWIVSLIFGSLLVGWLVKQANWNLWPVILWHGTFNFFTASDQIDALYPSIISMMVIVFVFWVARKYGPDLSFTKK